MGNSGSSSDSSGCDDNSHGSDNDVDSDSHDSDDADDYMDNYIDDVDSDDMEEELDQELDHDNPGIVSTLTNNIIKPCIKGGGVAAYATQKAMDKTPIIPNKLVQKSVMKQAAVGGCVAGVVDNALEKTVGIGLETGVKAGIDLLVKSNTDIMSGEREMELLNEAKKEMEKNKNNIYKDEEKSKSSKKSIGPCGVSR